MAPVELQTVPCERCGRRVVDGSFDFGGWGLHPVCGGIEVWVSERAWTEAEPVGHLDSRRLQFVVTADELRRFLEVAYGPR